MEDLALLEKFKEYTEEVIPQALFHINHNDIDDATGAHLDDMILLDILHENKDLLKVKDLMWFMRRFMYTDFYL